MAATTNNKPEVS